MKILLIEDSDTDAMIIERWVRPHTVVRVSNAAKAMAIKGAGFDLILCDMGLPDATHMTDTTTTATEILSEFPVPLVKISGAPRHDVIDKTQAAIMAAIQPHTIGSIE